jgi:hypothetical protein
MRPAVVLMIKVAHQDLFINLTLTGASPDAFVSFSETSCLQADNASV